MSVIDLAYVLKARLNEFDKLCEELRKLYFYYWIVGYTTAKTRNFSFRLIRLIKQGKSLSKIINEIDKKMKDDDVLDYIDGNLQDDVYGRPLLKPLLILIEYGQTDESVFIEYSRNLHIDHILPEEWEKKSYWRRRWTKEKAYE